MYDIEIESTLDRVIPAWNCRYITTITGGDSASLLQKFEQERLAILERIGKIRFMRRGTINEQYLSVNQKDREPLKRGPYYVFSRNEDGKTKSWRLKKNEVEQVQQDVEAYKAFQKLSKDYVDVAEALALHERTADDSDAVKKLICHEEFTSEIEKFCLVVRKNFTQGRSIGLEDLEEGMRDAALRDGARMLSSLLRQMPDYDGDVLCPVCQQKMYRDGIRVKQLTSLLGEGSVSRTTIPVSSQIVLDTGCLNRRICDITSLNKQLSAWESDRNLIQKGVDWQFSTDDARIKLKHLYPQFKS